VGEPTTNGNRWRARPVLAAVVIALSSSYPSSADRCSSIDGTSVGDDGDRGRLGLEMVCHPGRLNDRFIGCQRLTRRALSLTVLLRLACLSRVGRHDAYWWPSDLGRRVISADGSTKHGPRASVTIPPLRPRRSLVLFATISAHDARLADTSTRSRPSLT